MNFEQLGQTLFTAMLLRGVLWSEGSQQMMVKISEQCGKSCQ